MTKSTTKLNYYYVPKKSQYKLTKSVEPVIPTNKELELYLLLNIWDDKSIMYWDDKGDINIYALLDPKHNYLNN